VIATGSEREPNEPDKESGTQSGSAKVNLMGSEVMDGYKCKPVHKDPDRPILYYRYHLLLCAGERCLGSMGNEDFIDSFRRELEAHGLQSGNHRVKVTKTNCFGACRFRSVALLYENNQDKNGSNPNNGLWIRRFHHLPSELRAEFFRALKTGESLKEGAFGGFLIPMDPPGDG
jgi:hypothetical protein